MQIPVVNHTMMGHSFSIMIPSSLTQGIVDRKNHCSGEKNSIGMENLVAPENEIPTYIVLTLKSGRYLIASLW
jgi:hypothetical protein